MPLTALIEPAAVCAHVEDPETSKTTARKTADAILCLIILRMLKSTVVLKAV
jgi:hypothetical protein